MHHGQTLDEFYQCTKSRQQRRDEEEVPFWERCGRQTGQTLECNEMFCLIPRHQLNRLMRRDDGAIKSEAQRGKESELR